MNERVPKRNYRIINLILAGIILLLIFYSLAFSAEGLKHPVPSGSQWLTGESSPSTGMSRSFSAIVRFRFAEARQFNPHGIRIFSFFIVQLMLRIIVFMLLSVKNLVRLRVLAFTDGLIAVLLFIVCFWPFIAYLARQL